MAKKKTNKTTGRKRIFLLVLAVIFTVGLVTILVNHYTWQREQVEAQVADRKRIDQLEKFVDYKRNRIVQITGLKGVSERSCRETQGTFGDTGLITCDISVMYDDSLTKEQLSKSFDVDLRDAEKSTSEKNHYIIDLQTNIPDSICRVIYTVANRDYGGTLRTTELFCQSRTMFKYY